MTELLCRVCDHEIFEDETELNNYLASQRKPNDKSIYKNYVIKNIHLDNVDKILMIMSVFTIKNLIFILLNVILISLLIIRLQI